jgi:hypothetical protein
MLRYIIGTSQVHHWYVPGTSLVGHLALPVQIICYDKVCRLKYPSKSPLFLGSLSGYEPFLRFLCVGGRIGSKGRLAFGSVAEYLLSPTISGGEVALPLHCLPA